VEKSPYEKRGVFIDIECIIDRERERERERMRKGGGSVGIAAITRRMSQTDVAKPFGVFS